MRSQRLGVNRIDERSVIVGSALSFTRAFDDLERSKHLDLDLDLDLDDRIHVGSNGAKLGVVSVGSIGTHTECEGLVRTRSR